MSSSDIELTLLIPLQDPAPHHIVPTTTFERCSRIVTRILPHRNANEELGDSNCNPSKRWSFSPLIAVLVTSLIINIICVGVFLYQEFPTVDDIMLEEQCVIKKLVQDKFMKIYNNNIFEASLTDKTCDIPLKQARKYVQTKIDALMVKPNQNDDNFDEDHDRLNEKIDLADLVMITQYIDKMIDGPHGCLPSKCTILENRQHDKTSILCDFNYKAKFKED